MLLSCTATCSQSICLTFVRKGKTSFKIQKIQNASKFCHMNIAINHKRWYRLKLFKRHYSPPHFRSYFYTEKTGTNTLFKHRQLAILTSRTKITANTHKPEQTNFSKHILSTEKNTQICTPGFLQDKRSQEDSTSHVSVTPESREEIVGDNLETNSLCLSAISTLTRTNLPTYPVQNWLTSEDLRLSLPPNPFF